MTRRLLPLALLLFLAGPSAAARTPEVRFFDRFRIGVEWGYSQCFFRSRDYNFLSEEGYRVYHREKGFHFRANGTLLAQFACRLGDRFDAALCTGYVGAGEDNRLLPLLLRLHYFPKEDGLFLWMQGGPAWHVQGHGRAPAWMETLGLGRRFILVEDLALDLQLGLKFVQDRPLIMRTDGPGRIPDENILRSRAFLCALDLTIGVSF